MNVAGERDFNRVEIDGQSPDVIEQALSPFENRAVEAYRNVNNIHKFSNEEDITTY